MIRTAFIGSNNSCAVVLWVKLTELTADSFVIFTVVGIMGFRTRGVFTELGEIRRGSVYDLFDRINTINERIKLAIKEALYKAVESL